MSQAIQSAVPWFPQEYAETFYTVKGLIALIALVLYLAHMNRAWPRLVSVAQRWRYGVLLYLAAWLATSAAEQVKDEALVNYRNLGGMVGSLLLIVAAIVSLHEDRRTP